MTTLLEAAVTDRAPRVRVIGEERSTVGLVDNRPQFSIWRVIDDALAGAESPDPADLVDVVMKHIAAWEREPALRQLLVGAIKQRAKPGAPDITGERGGAATHRSMGGPSKSSKWEGIAAATRDPLRYMVRVDGEMKFLGDCTAEDVRELEQRRFKVAKQQLGKAKQYRALHKAMLAAGAETVADLGGDRVGEIIK